MEDETLEQRLRAVERAVADSETPDHLADVADLAARVDDVETDLAEVSERLADVEAAVQALRGYVGAARGVNRDVERRADSALAKVERLESDLAADRRPGRREGETDPAGDRRDDRTAGRETAHPIPEPSRDEETLLDRIGAWL